MAKKNTTSPAKLRKLLRRKNSIEMRIKGHSYNEIGEALKCAPTTACRDVRETIQGLEVSIADRAPELRAIENMRLDKMQSGVYETSISGDTQAIAAAIKIQERRAKLMGLDVGKDQPTINLLVSSPEWAQLKGRLFLALEPYPEARDAVVAALSADSETPPVLVQATTVEQ